MKKHLSCGVLLTTVSSISLSCNSLTLNIKDTRPITEPPRATILAAIQAIPGKTQHPFIRFMNKHKGRLAALLGLLWLWLLTSLHYRNEKGRQASRWEFYDLAVLKAIKDNAFQLCNINRPDRKVIRLEEWER